MSLPTALKDTSTVPIGAAIDVSALGNNPTYRGLVDTHYNAFTPENVMKMGPLVPDREGGYVWDDADRFVEYGKSIGATVHGHVLVWHEQLPEWVKRFEGDREDWNRMLKNHIETVVGRYKGQITSWDVVNEAIRDSCCREFAACGVGPCRCGSAYRNTIWYQKLGPGYIGDAFRWAHAADPEAKLYYNEYNLCTDEGKLHSVVAMLERLIDDEVPVHGLGFQGHFSRGAPSKDQISAALEHVERLPLDFRVSELDITLNKPKLCGCWPRMSSSRSYTEEDAKLQERRFEDVVTAFTTCPRLTGITLWGVSDGHSWRNQPPDNPDWPLLFDLEYKPKRAAVGFVRAIERSKYAKSPGGSEPNIAIT